MEYFIRSFFNYKVISLQIFQIWNIIFLSNLQFKLIQIEVGSNSSCANFYLFILYYLYYLN